MKMELCGNMLMFGWKYSKMDFQREKESAHNLFLSIEMIVKNSILFFSETLI